jgi:hypothetical protein
MLPFPSPLLSLSFPSFLPSFPPSFLELHERRRRKKDEV